MTPTDDALWLMHEGALALSEVESTGMPIDVVYLDQQIEVLGAEIKALRREVVNDEVFQIWFRRYGDNAKLSAREQLGEIVFGALGYERKPGVDNNDESAFEHVDHPFVKKVFQLEKLQADRNKTLMGIREELVDGRLHCNFNLNIAKSYRSTGDSPNPQNWPIRDPVRGKRIRTCFIAPDDDYCLVETDFKGIEVRGNSCYSHDPNLINYILDPKTDMHRDMAMQIFKLEQEEVSKHSRYAAKNMFVFPQFYGDWYKANAKQLWEAIEKMSLTAGGTPMLEHLAAQGITERGDCDPDKKPKPGTFEYHMKQVEEDFRSKRFKVHWEWMDKWYQEYRKRGWLRMFTGFVVSGLYTKKEVVNYPVQGSSFHCLLWSLIHIVKYLRKSGMKSRVINQIHDSIVAYVHKSEYDDYITICKDVMTRQIMEEWKWLIVPLEIEVEVCPYGGNWSQKKEIVI